MDQMRYVAAQFSQQQLRCFSARFPRQWARHQLGRKRDAMFIEHVGVSAITLLRDEVIGRTAHEG